MSSMKTQSDIDTAFNYLGSLVIFASSTQLARVSSVRKLNLSNAVYCKQKFF